MGFELTNTQNIIKRSGIFDEVDSKYGIPEEEREKAQEAADAGGEDGGGMGMPPLGGGGGSSAPEPDAGGSEPLSEGKKDKKRKLLSLLESEDNHDLFNMEKAQKNIYEIENKLNNLLND
jgi:hypothetical protein